MNADTNNDSTNDGGSHYSLSLSIHNQSLVHICARPAQLATTSNPRIEEVDVAIYMAERLLKNIGIQDLAAAQQSAISKAEEFRRAGTPIRYIRSAFTPHDGRCMCLFEAEDAAEVRRLNDEAHIPYVSVVEALDLTPQ
jgi:Protein of unknown function (DUF4242)